MAVMASWASTSFPLGAEDVTIFCTQTETYFSRSLLGLTSCQLLFFDFSDSRYDFCDSFTFFNDFFQKRRSSDKHSTGSRVYPLSGLSPLMSMSSEPANPSMDVRMNASYELFVERVAQFLNDDSCAWASIFLERREPMMHLPMASRLVHRIWESDEPRVLAFCCYLPRIVELSPRNSTRKRATPSRRTCFGFSFNNFTVFSACVKRYFLSCLQNC